MGNLRDLVNDINIKGANVVSEAGTTPVVSGIVDTAGYQSATAIVITGSLADVDATFTMLIEDGDAANLSDAAAVADAFLVGTEVLGSFTFAADNGARKIGYKGPKRYVRCTITPAANASAALIGVAWLLGHPRSRPQANPPA